MDEPAIGVGARNAPPQLHDDDDARPILTVNNMPLDTLRVGALKAIGAACAKQPRNPPLVVLGSTLKRPDTSGVHVSLDDCDATTMRHVLSNVALFRAMGDKGARWVYPPLDLARDLMVPPWRTIPVCDGVVNHPVLVPQGLRTEQGYDAASGVWIAGVSVEAPANVTDEQLALAKEVLDNLFSDFPFVSLSDKANLYAMLITAIVRRVISGPVPAFVSEAPTPGTGKSLALEVCGAVLLGGDVAFRPMPKLETEREKVLPVMAMRSELVLLDNVDGKFESDYLEMMITAPAVAYRMLGVSQEQEFPMRAIVAISGNNMQFSKAMYRRCVFIQFDAQMEEPAQRKGFRIANIKEWAQINRDKVLSALLTIVQAWRERGEVRGAHTMGSFEAWASIVGGVLGVIGMGDAFLGNREALRADKVADEDAVRDFVFAWAEEYGEMAVPVKTLFYLAAPAPTLPPGVTMSYEVIQERGKYHGLLGDLIVGSNETGQRKGFGLLLKRYMGRVYGSWKIVKQGRSNGDTLWRLQPAQAGHAGEI